jgi:excisionase family DNA binding protein
MAVIATYPSLTAYIRAAVVSSRIRRYNVPTEDAGSLLGISRQRLNMLVQEGRLDAVKIEGRRMGYLFAQADLEARAREKQARSSRVVDGGQGRCLG